MISPWRLFTCAPLENLSPQISNYLNLSRLITELAFQYNPEKKKQFSVEEPTDNKTEGGSSGEERDQEQG